MSNYKYGLAAAAGTFLVLLAGSQIYKYYYDNSIKPYEENNGDKKDVNNDDNAFNDKK